MYRTKRLGKKTLGDLEPGESGVVTQVQVNSTLQKRLIEMGVTPGARLLVRRYAPLGDPMQVSLRGYDLALRRADATKIEILWDRGNRHG